jgi:hypothetical protein
VALPAEDHGDGVMARVTETEEIRQGLVAEVRIGGMMHLGRHMLLPEVTAIAVALKDQATLLAPGLTAQIAEIGGLHAPPLPWPRLAWITPIPPAPMPRAIRMRRCAGRRRPSFQDVTGHGDVPAASWLVQRSRGGAHHPLAHGLSALPGTAGLGGG